LISYIPKFDMEILFLCFLFFLGICIGSFLGVIIDRLPRGESISAGRSYCEFCKKKLTFFDLVPLFSFLFLKGRCRYCHKRLSWYYPLVEVTTGILFVLVGITTGVLHTTELVYYLFLVSVLVAIFFIDLKYGIIPFALILPAVLVVLFYLLTTQQSLLVNNFFAALGAMGFFLTIFLVTRGRGMGFGDVVYAFLMGLLLGFPQIIVGLYIAFVSGAAISLILIVRKQKKMKGGTVPFGPFLVVGTLVSLFWGNRLIDIAMVYLTN
jgi:leader peptidase (prepilin peptidase) / N-methyltransferase